MPPAQILPYWDDKNTKNKPSFCKENEGCYSFCLLRLPAGRHGAQHELHESAAEKSKLLEIITLRFHGRIFFHVVACEVYHICRTQK